MQLQFPDETIYWAMGKLLPLFRLRGAPKTVKEREAYAAAILRIAHPALVDRHCKDAFAPIMEEEIPPLAEAPVPFLESVLLANVNPFYWLVDTLVDESQWFPEAVTARAIFIEKFPCADGKKMLEAER